MNKKKIQNSSSQFNISKYIFEKLYVVPIIILVVMLIIFYNNNEVTNKKILADLKKLPEKYTIDQAMTDDKLVNYYGIITNVDTLYGFVDKCKDGKNSTLTYVSCNDLNEVVIKTVLHKNNKFYVNVDTTRTSSKNKEIKTYTFTEYELIDDDNKLALTLSNKEDTMNFFEYMKK